MRLGDLISETLHSLTSNKVRLDAHRFYEKLGFAKSHEGFKLML